MSTIAMPTPIKEPKKKADKNARTTPWRDNIEAMLMAIIMAIVLKYFLVEAYRIPTGSMQPTLMGNDDVGVYDRILVDKFSYQMRDPARFEVAVFRYPLDRSKNYVKRIVGVGPEFFRVEFGDLWNRQSEDEPWQIIRRPAHVEAETWLRLAKHEPDAPLFYGAVDPKWKAGRDFELKGDSRIRFGPSRAGIMDAYTDGYPDAIKDALANGRRRGRGSSHPVGDLRVDGTIEVSAATEWFAVEIQEGALRYDLRIPGPAGAADATAQIRVRDGSQLSTAALVELQIQSKPLRLEAGKSYDFVAQNLDDRLSIELDGELLCQADIEPNPALATGLYIETKGGQVTFEDMMVYRDIYYTNDQGIVTETFIPEGNYFMMGDNTLDSSDSRMWQEHRLNLMGPDEELVTLTGNHRRSGGLGGQSDFTNDNNPITDSRGTEDLRPLTWFRDIWGEMHVLEAGEYAPASPMTASAPFVERDEILGRAIAVFWPIRPFDSIYRFKSVD